jgi:hypothetical protein
MLEMLYYCESYGQPFVVTETVTNEKEDMELKRVSSSHREGRAWDVRTRDWSESFIAQFVEHFTNLYNDIGAVSLLDKKRKFIVDKSKTIRPHLHCQLDKLYARTIPWRH